MTDFPDPGRTDDLRELLLTYLDFYRGVVTTKVSGLDEDAYTTSCVPSGWTVAGLVNRLIHMERRWLHWGFAGEPVDQPWADRAGDGWVSPDTDVEALLGELAIVGAHTRCTVEQHDLADLASVGGRFTTPEAAPQLQWILLHVLQEYARHAGHLDISRELIDGSVGESPPYE